ncbi:hypothetical protein KKC59_02070 [bacterium]|nr:hypothetical protein [bacterium]
MKGNKDNEPQINITCPWCGKDQSINSMPNNMIMAFNCKFCEEPIVVIQNKPLKINKDVLETGEILKLQEYILDLLEKEFNINAEIENIEQVEMPEIQEEYNKEETKREKKEEETKHKPKKPISENEISTMKKFLDDFKVPRDGSMFDE